MTRVSFTPTTSLFFAAEEITPGQYPWYHEAVGNAHDLSRELLGITSKSLTAHNLDRLASAWSTANMQKIIADPAQGRYLRSVLEQTRVNLHHLSNQELYHKYVQLRGSELQSFLVSLATAFGEILCRRLDMHWAAVQDQFGWGVATKSMDRSYAVYPFDLVTHRFARPEVEIFQKSLAEIEAELTSLPTSSYLS